MGGRSACHARAGFAARTALRRSSLSVSGCQPPAPEQRLVVPRHGAEPGLGDVAVGDVDRRPGRGPHPLGGDADLPGLDLLHQVVALAPADALRERRRALQRHLAGLDEVARRRGAPLPSGRARPPRPRGRPTPRPGAGGRRRTARSSPRRRPGRCRSRGARGPRRRTPWGPCRRGGRRAVPGRGAPPSAWSTPRRRCRGPTAGNRPPARTRGCRPPGRTRPRRATPACSPAW